MKSDKLFYFESGLGCGIRKAKSIKQARELILREVGTANYEGNASVREASVADIRNVKAMGGWIG